MTQNFFKALAKANKKLLPSYSKQQLDLGKASKFQLAISKTGENPPKKIFIFPIW